MATEMKSVLLVEDDADSRELLAELLKAEGFEVSQAENGLIALDMIGANKPDVVIADLLMPLMDGIELAKRVRTDHQKTIRLIALTGISPKKSLGLSHEAGFDYYVTKPVSGKDLVPYIRDPMVDND